MSAPTTYANPYWDAVSDQVRESDMPWRPGLTVGGLGDWKPMIRRGDLTSEYAWTVTDPASVAFVAEHAGGRVIDPLAGTGYWAHILGQHGIDVAASDLNPPGTAVNEWHRAGKAFVPVAARDAVDAVEETDRTLLLSWPPYDDPIGAAVLNAYRGDRVIYIGEGEYGCCGTDEMFSAFESDWTQVAEHQPVQWYGMHDWITVYDRKDGAQ